MLPFFPYGYLQSLSQNLRSKQSWEDRSNRSRSEFYLYNYKTSSFAKGNKLFNWIHWHFPLRYLYISATELMLCESETEVLPECVFTIIFNKSAEAFSSLMA